MNFSIFTNFFKKFRGINYGLQPVRCPRGGLSCARRAAGCAPVGSPVGPPVGPPMGAVFRLKILFLYFFTNSQNSVELIMECSLSGAPGVACHAPVERPDVCPWGRPWGHP